MITKWSTEKNRNQNLQIYENGSMPKDRDIPDQTKRETIGEICQPFLNRKPKEFISLSAAYRNLAFMCPVMVESILSCYHMR